MALAVLSASTVPDPNIEAFVDKSKLEGFLALLLLNPRSPVVLIGVLN